MGGDLKIFGYTIAYFPIETIFFPCKGKCQIEEAMTMPVIIKADQWDFNPDAIDTGCLPNHGLKELTTEEIIVSFHELTEKPELEELNRLIMCSSQFSRKIHATN